ncbi:ECF transporter S component [Microbacterium sp. RG1]|uniref:ECF transporter S component n=1 Tax=Microbacterium sp. RG1 TaxID=2489212 RepID=UPI00137644B7|nr:ECF transporter S component [Microbacterium sp. RG1]
MIRRASRTLLPTRVLLTCAAIAAASTVLLTVTNLAAKLLIPAFPPSAYVLAGLWVVPATLALALLRRPGVGVLTGLIVGLVMTPFSPQGASVILATLWWSAACELPFLLARYRRWTLPLHVGGGIVAGLVSIAVSFTTGVLTVMPLAAQIVTIGLSLVSPAVAAASCAAVARRLRHAGVGGQSAASGGVSARGKPSA